jgi:iron complex outermembrane recepter protein
LSIAVRQSEEPSAPRSADVRPGHRGGRALLPATFLVVLGPVLPAAAQDTELDQIVVTGSRIARPDFSSASPIVSVTQELFERSGARTVEAALNTLPQFVPSWTGSSNFPGNGGQANVDLRGLGTTSTLVLVDGKRLMPANGSGVADLNIIPSSLIESVEIITGGASAVYGSDALAGVVNFKLKRKFDGVEVEGTWGQTDRGDGTQYETGLTAGTDFAGGRGSIVGFVGYVDRGQVNYADREFSRYALVYLEPGAGTLGPDDSFLPFGSSFIEEGRVSFPLLNRPSPEAFEVLMARYDQPPGTVPYQRNFGFNADGSLFTQGAVPFFLAQVPAVANYRYPRDPVFFNQYVYTYNFAPLNALQLPLERKSAFVRGEFELGDSTRVYAQGLYADYEVNTQQAATPLFDDTFMPVTNPFIPADLRLLLESRPDPAADFTFAKRLGELGPRVVSNRYDVYQATVGLSGGIFDGWEYDAYVQVGANDQTNHQTGSVLRSRIEELTYAPDGGVSICGGFDPFGLNSISRECLDYISVEASNHAEVDQTIVEASLSGPALALPAGELRVALGAFYKEDSYEYSASPVASRFLPVPGSTCPPDCRQDIAGFVASDDIRGDDHNVDLYAEALVPVLTGLHGVESLEAVLGYRLSDYESAGSFDSWKAELLYRPIGSLRLRGSYQEAVRAASVSELYRPQLPATFEYFFEFPTGLEPCEVGSLPRSGPDAARVEALCLAQGVPAALLPDFGDSNGIADGRSGGNPDLGPEEATTTTFGLVWTPRATQRLLANLQISLDWYRIDIADRITAVPFGEFVSFCFDPPYNPEMSASNQWCSLFARDAATGEIEDARQLLLNASDWETDGVDVQLDWRFDLGPGQLGVNWLVSWIDSITIRVEDSSAPTDDLVGTIGLRSVAVGTGSAFISAFPEWKSSLRVSYGWQDLMLGAGWRYIDSMIDGDATLDPVFRVPHVDYFDLDASYAFSAGPLAGLELRVGVENLTDEDPPIFPSYIQANTDPSQYDVLGRRYYASLRYSF